MYQSLVYKLDVNQLPFTGYLKREAPPTTMRPFTNLNTWDFIVRTLPIFQFLKKYDANTAICDLVAGITVGLTLIPQVIAYASLAGLDPQVSILNDLIN